MRGKTAKIAAKTPKERAKHYRSLFAHLTGLSDALTEGGSEAGEARALRIAAAQCKAAEAAIFRAESLRESCCWEAVSFGSCRCVVAVTSQ